MTAAVFEFATAGRIVSGASSMRGNPVALSQADLKGILLRAL